VRIAPSRIAELVAACSTIAFSHEVHGGSASIRTGEALKIPPPERGLLRHALLRRILLPGVGTRFEYRTTRPAELRRVLPQARYNPADVGYLLTAEPEYVGCTGHLLFQSSPVFLGNSGRPMNDAAHGRNRKAQQNSVRSHVPILTSDFNMRGIFKVCAASSIRPTGRFRVQINEAGEGSRQTTKRECPPVQIFQAKWIAVRVKKARQNERLEPR